MQDFPLHSVYNRRNINNKYRNDNNENLETRFWPLAEPPHTRESNASIALLSLLGQFRHPQMTSQPQGADAGAKLHILF